MVPIEIDHVRVTFSKLRVKPAFQEVVINELLNTVMAGLDAQKWQILRYLDFAFAVLQIATKQRELPRKVKRLLWAASERSANE